MSEIQFNENTYSIGKLDAFKQLHVTRRILPILIASGISIADIAKGAAAATEDGSVTLRVFEKGVEVVSKMSDEDVNYVVSVCLGVVGRKQSDGRFAPIMNGRQMMFADTDFSTIVRLTIEVLRANVSGFFQAVQGGQLMPSGS